jgi:anti-sigma factor RsiW
MGVVTLDDLTALADGVLPPSRRARVEAAVAASPELASLLRVQLETAQTIRTAAAQVEAPESLRRLIEQRRATQAARFRRERLVLRCVVTIAVVALLVRRRR